MPPLEGQSVVGVIYIRRKNENEDEKTLYVTNGMKPERRTVDRRKQKNSEMEGKREDGNRLIRKSAVVAKSFRPCTTTSSVCREAADWSIRPCADESIISGPLVERVLQSCRV
jgi:hypothetical protein